MWPDRRAAPGRTPPGRVALACAFGAVLATSACSTSSSTSTGSAVDGLRLDFTRPEPPADVSVSLGGASASAAANAVSDRLRAAGMNVTSVNATTGTVLAWSDDSALVNCGEVTQTLDGNRATFPGNAPTAVVFAFGQPGDIVLREVATETWIEIGIVPGAGSTAVVGEVHKVTIRHLSADRSQTVWSQTESFDGRSVATFSDGTSCTSSGAVRGLLG